MIDNLKTITSDRKVRPVVIPSGQRARGRFPSLKAGNEALTFESLHEQQVLQVLEVASAVTQIKARPMVLRLGGKTSFHYTPDFIIRHQAHRNEVVCEAKGDFFLSSPGQRQRLQNIAGGLRDAGVPFFVVLQSDFCVELQQMTGMLLQRRPWPLHGTRGSMTKTHAWQKRCYEWQRAEEVCDALLSRLMCRSIPQTISAASQGEGRAK